MGRKLGRGQNQLDSPCGGGSEGSAVLGPRSSLQSRSLTGAQPSSAPPCPDQAKLGSLLLRILQLLRKVRHRQSQAGSTQLPRGTSHTGSWQYQGSSQQLLPRERGKVEEAVRPTYHHSGTEDL